MDTVAIAPAAPRSATIVFALFTAGLGFAAGWVASRPGQRPGRVLPVIGVLTIPVVTPPLMPPPVCTHGLADDEEDCPGATTAIVREAPFQYRIDRKVFACLLSQRPKPDRLAPNLRIFATTENGRPAGFTIYAVRPGNLFARLGFQNGDHLYSVNGMSFATPDRALQAYSQLRSATRFTVEFSRLLPAGGRQQQRQTYRLVSS